MGDPLVGHRLGTFEALRTLGRGAAGTVNEVSKPDDPRSFAAKVLNTKRVQMTSIHTS